MNLHKKDWASRLPKELWAYRISWKTTIGFTTFELLYEKINVLPIEFEYKTLWTTLDLDMDIFTAQQDHIMQLNALDEYRKQSLHHTELIQQ